MPKQSSVIGKIWLYSVGCESSVKSALWSANTDAQAVLNRGSLSFLFCTNTIQAMYGQHVPLWGSQQRKWTTMNAKTKTMMSLCCLLSNFTNVIFFLFWTRVWHIFWIFSTVCSVRQVKKQVLLVGETLDAHGVMRMTFAIGWCLKRSSETRASLAHVSSVNFNVKRE